MTTPLPIKDLGLLMLILIKEDKLWDSTIAIVHGPGMYPTALVDRMVQIIDLFWVKKTVNNKTNKRWDSGGPQLVICSSGSMALRGRSVSTVLLVDVPEKDQAEFYTTYSPIHAANRSRIFSYQPELEAV